MYGKTGTGFLINSIKVVTNFLYLILETEQLIFRVIRFRWIIGSVAGFDCNKRHSLPPAVALVNVQIGFEACK